MKALRIFSTILILILALASCAPSDAEEADAPPPQPASKLFVSLPSELDSFFTEGYAFFESELAAQSGGQIEYAVDRSQADAQSQAVLSALGDGFTHFYIHPCADGALDDAMVQVQAAGGKVYLFGETAAITPEMTISFDCGDMGAQLSKELKSQLTGITAEKPLLLMLPLEGFYAYDFISGLEKALNGAFDFHPLNGGDVYESVSTYINSLDKDGLKRVFAIIAPDAESAAAAQRAIADFRGSISLRVKRIAYIGATVESLEKMAYAPVAEAALDLTPVLMVGAARSVWGAVVSGNTGELTMRAHLINNENAADFMLSESYLIRYHAGD